MNPQTLFFVANTSTVLDPYTTYVAATCSLPGRSRESSFTVSPGRFFQIPNIEPMLTATSMLDEPSNGSINTIKPSATSPSTMTGFSISSQPMAATWPDWESVSTKISELAASRRSTISP